MVRIIFMNPPAYMPAYYADSDGFYSLDLNNKEKIALTKKIDDYVNIGTIKQDTFKEIAIPITNKNILLLEGVGNPNSISARGSKIFDIQILKGDYSYPAQGLQVIETNENDNSFQCVIFGETADWVRKLNNSYLNTLDLGSEICDEFFVKTTLPQKHAYQDGDYPVFAPLVNYGKWFINHNQAAFSAKSQVVFNNYRYWYSATALMKQIFCEAGYELVAPILETDYYRRVWLYLLDPNFETANQADKANRAFKTTRTTPTPLAAYDNNSAMNLRPVVSDPGSHELFFASAAPPQNYEGVFYSAGVYGNFLSSGTVTFTSPLAQILIPTAPEFLTVKVSICKSDRYGHDNQQSLIDYSTILASKTFIRDTAIPVAGVVNFNFDLSTGDIKVYQHEVVFLRIEVFAYLVESGTGVVHDAGFVRTNSDLSSGSTFEVVPNLQVIEKGDTLDFGLMLRKDITRLQLAKGIMHLHNLKIETDSIAKKVYMYPEFKMDLVPNDGIQEGYFRENQDNAFEATDKIVVRSLKQGFINNDKGRYAYLKFQDSTDGFIKKQNFERELHSKYVDFGADFKDEENKIENPLFEPTMLAEDGNIGINDPTNPPTYLLKTINYIPFLWEGEGTNEGEYPEQGYNFAPRLGIAYPLSLDIRSIVNNPLIPALQGSVYEDTFNYQKNCFGQVFQTTPIYVQYYISGTPYDPDLSIVYGQAPFDLDTGSDLWTMIYSLSIRQGYLQIAINLMAEIDLSVFSNLSFRQKWHLIYDSLAWGQINIYARLGQIQDYVIGENIVTPIELVPDAAYFLDCD